MSDRVDFYTISGTDAKFTTKVDAAGTTQALSDRIDQVKADLEQAKIGGDAKAPDMSAYATKEGVAASYLSKTDAETVYAKKLDLNAYQPAGSYATTTQLAGLQPKGDYATKAEVNAKTAVRVTDNLDGTATLEW